MLRFALLACLCLAATSSGGCLVSLTNAQYALADVGPLGWVMDEVRPAPWCDVVEADSGDGRPVLVVPTAVVRHWPPLALIGREPLGVRLVVLELNADYRPPEAVAVPDAAGMTAEELERWVAGLDAAERAALVQQARAARAAIVAQRGAPEPMRGRDWSRDVRGVAAPDEPLPPSPAAVDVIRLADGAFIAAYRRPADVAEPAWHEEDLLQVAHVAIPPPRPPATGPPNPAAYHAAVVLPMSFQTSGGDRAARAATGLLMSPLALAYDAVIVGVSLLPLAMLVGVVVAVT